jgi:hypothetical protein
VGLGLDEIDGGKLNRLDDTFALQYRYFNCWSIFPIHKQTTYCEIFFFWLAWVVLPLL